MKLRMDSAKNIDVNEIMMALSLLSFTDSSLLSFFLLLKMKNDKETWEESEGKRMGVEKEKRLCYL